jgi:hypothetical protein
VLRRVFGPKRNEITKKLRRALYNEELYALYSSPNTELVKSRRLREAGHVERTGRRRGAYKVLVGKPEQRRLLERPRS